MPEDTAPEFNRSVRLDRIARNLRKTIVAAALSISTLALVTLNAPVASASPVAALYNTAQRAFVDGNVRAGLDALNQAVGLDPGNTDVLALRAFWGTQAADLIAREDSLNRLGALDPDKRAGVLNAINAITSAALTPPTPFPSIQGGQTAIVVLGYGLLPNGALRPELINRLGTAWVQAVAAPFSPIITTGGSPRNGVSEGQAMAAWLIGHGIPASRIHPETRATSTVQNALYSADIIRSIGASSAVIVTSANHIRRGTADFNIAGIPVLGAMATLDHLVGQLLPLPLSAQRGMYIDATRVFGLPASL